MLCSTKTCYTCLKTTSKELVEMSKLDHDKITYLDKLLSCVSTNLIEVQEIKMELCFSCIEKLRICYQFKHMVLESQVMLQNIYGHQKCGTNKLNNVESGLEVLDVKGENVNPTYKDSLDFKNIENVNEVSNDSDYFLADLKVNIIEGNKSCNVYGDNSKTESLNNITSDNSIFSDSQAKLEEKLCHNCHKNIFEYVNEDFSELYCYDCKNLDKEVKLNDNNKNKINNVNKSRKPKISINHFCEFCGSKFDKRWKLSKHKSRVHVDHKKYVCSFCNKSFKQSYHLREHLTSHTGEKNYTCDYCEKQFQRVSSLRRHIRSHEAAPGQKTKRTPFLCTICGKSFPFSNGVQRHMKIHLGIKNHECAICKRKFTQSTHLHVHMRTHTGEKPYICDTCGEAFSLNAGLQKHINVHKKNAQKSKSVKSFFVKSEKNT